MSMTWRLESSICQAGEQCLPGLTGLGDGDGAPEGQDSADVEGSREVVRGEVAGLVERLGEGEGAEDDHL